MSAQRLIGLVGRVFNPQRVKRLTELELVMETWQSNTIEYENFTKTFVPEIARRYALRQLVPQDLEKDLIKLCTSLGSFQEDCKFVREQIAMSKPAQFGDRGDKKPKGSGELEALLARIQEYKGENNYDKDENQQEQGDYNELDNAEMELNALKGNWKGHGKGKFEGNCHHCGKFGHRINQCWEKDKEMNALRKGKEERKEVEVKQKDTEKVLQERASTTTTAVALRVTAMAATRGTVTAPTNTASAVSRVTATAATRGTVSVKATRAAAKLFGLMDNPNCKDSGTQATDHGAGNHIAL